MSRPAQERISELISTLRSSSEQYEPLTSPLDGQQIAQIRQSDLNDVAIAFAKAHAAQRRWSSSSCAERKRILLRLHDVVLDHQEELLDLIQLESGKSRHHAFDEIAHVALTARYYARRVGRIMTPKKRNGALPVLTSVHLNRVPKGVVGIISPWNYPLTMALSDGIAALAAGNAIVHKPDSQTPLSALAGVELLREAGFPAEIWQVVTGPGTVIGTAIVDQADYIAFTGSTPTGTEVAGRLASRLVGSSLELGGKNPMIVLPGADVEKAAAGAVEACFSSAGQLCVSIERLYVHEDLYTAFRDALVRRVQALSLGASFDWEVDIGSLVSTAQLEKVTKHLDNALAHGAVIAAGGKPRPDIGPYFFEPTVLEGVPASADCFAEETFGPLVSLYSYAAIGEAMSRANEGELGLNASIWGDAAQARALAPHIKAGTVNINEGFAASFGSIDAPMGGMGKSGMGRRQGEEGILRFTEAQSVASQRVLPMAGPEILSHRTYARLLTAGLKALRRIPRA